MQKTKEEKGIAVEFYKIIKVYKIIILKIGHYCDNRSPVNLFKALLKNIFCKVSVLSYSRPEIQPMLQILLIIILLKLINNNYFIKNNYRIKIES